MHELPVTQSIIEVACTAAEQAGGRAITAIDLLIGDLSSIVDDSVQFYFDILSRGTLAEGAQLRFRREPATLVCGDCGQQAVATPPLPAACPACGSPMVQLSGGRAFLVESIEVADDGPGGGDEGPGGEVNLEQQRSDCGREPGAL